MRIEEMDIKKLIAVATGKIPHNYRNGLCPDELQPESRDQDCQACKILIEAATEHDAMERRLREAEARVAELEAERAEREKQEPIFWYLPCCGGELYDGPVHNDSITGKWMREERPEEWVPLIAKPIKPARGEG